LGDEVSVVIRHCHAPRTLKFRILSRFSKEISLKRVKRWGFSLRELLKDPAGREQVSFRLSGNILVHFTHKSILLFQFAKFLDKEFSGENLK
jgi:regulator of G-protein signaling